MPKALVACFFAGGALFATSHASAATFEDNFESGDLSRWAASQTDGGDLRVSAAAALNGSLGLAALVDDTKALYVQTQSRLGDISYARFLLDPNGFDPGAHEGAVSILELLPVQNQGQPLCSVVLSGRSDKRTIRGLVRLDSGGVLETTALSLTDTVHLVEVEWQRSSTPSASDGAFRLRIDHTFVATLAGLSIGSMDAGVVRLGVLDPRGNSRGEIFFDDFADVKPTAGVVYTTGGGSLYGAVWAHCIEPSSGVLEEILGSPYPAGKQSVWVTTDPQQRTLYSASLVEGTVFAHRIDEPSGTLRPVEGSPFAVPGAAAVSVHPSAEFAYVASWTQGKVYGYLVNEDGGLAEPTVGSPYEGVGNAISMAMDPFGRFLFVANQGQGSISVFSIDNLTGALVAVSGSPFPTGLQPLSVDVHPSGRFVYVANYESGDVSGFYVDSSSGELTPVPGSPFPARISTFALSVDPSGRFLFVATAAPPSGPFEPADVLVYSIDTASGALSDLGAPAKAGISNYDLATDPSGRFLYAADVGTGAVFGFSIDSGTGRLTSLPGSPFPFEPRQALFSLVVLAR
jgi:6-phosphogluconolactonase (cycloisomerase 2 family)